MAPRQFSWISLWYANRLKQGEWLSLFDGELAPLPAKIVARLLERQRLRQARL
jgi:hypothetical protein